MKIPKYRKRATRDRGFAEWQGKRMLFPGPYNSPESIAAYKHFLSDQVLPSQSVAPLADELIHSAPTVNRVVALYLKFAKDFYHDNPREFAHQRIAALHLAEHYGNFRVKDFGPLALDDLRSKWIGTRRTPPRRKAETPAKEMPLLTRAHINHQVGRIRQLFRWAVSKELCPSSMTAALASLTNLQAGKTAARESPAVEAVPWEVASAVLPHVSPMVASMIELQYLSGMRSGELCRLTPAEIDFSSEVWVYKPKKHKTASRGKAKVICFGPQAQRLIAPWMIGIADDQSVFSPRRAEKHRLEALRLARKTPVYGRQKANGPADLSHLSDRYTSQTYRRAVLYGIRKARKENPGLRSWHPHMLRHARAEETRREHGLQGSKAVLGNTISATQLYSAQDIDLARRIAKENG